MYEIVFIAILTYYGVDGQTGSGKSFSMVGSASDKGIIPRVCHALFHMIDDERRTRGDALFKVEASYLEIYNEVIALQLSYNIGY